MTTYKPNPTYYRVTWNQASPTNYTNLLGTRAGGLDGVSAYKYNNRVTVTGTQPVLSSNVLADGQTMIINQVTIPFDSSMDLQDIITQINLYSLMTDVIAHNGVQSDYLTLTNGMNHAGDPIDLMEGTGALAILGFEERAYTKHPSDVGSTFTNFADGDSFTINGIIITMSTAGGLDQTGAVSTINAKTREHGMIAQRAGTKIQLVSQYGGPWSLGGANISKLGFTAGNHGGYPTNITLSLRKTYANMRWEMVIQQLSMFATPFMVNDQLGTGNYNGQSELTTLSFTIGYEHPDQIATEDELNPGTMLYGTAAIKRAVARALTSNNNMNMNVFDPSLESRGAYCVRPNPIRVMNITVQGIDVPANILTIEGNVEVSMIAFA
jgi:hypothetical protein